MPCCESWTSDLAPSQAGKVCVITGANSGIGFETAKAVGRLGAHVIMACRSAGRANKAREELEQAVPGGKFEVLPLDLADIESVHTFSTALAVRGQPVDQLVLNAGIMMLQEYTTTPPQGPQQSPMEMQFMCNHLGHFLLVPLLMPLLAKAKDPRVVILSSSMARLAGTWKEASVPDMVLSKAAYDSQAVYGNTKLANLLFMHELRRRYPNLFVIAAHPGYVNTNLQQHMTISMNWIGQAPWKGALPSLRALLDRSAQPGTLYGPRLGFWGYPVLSSHYHVDIARNEQLGKALWDKSVELTGAAYPAEFTPLQ